MSDKSNKPDNDNNSKPKRTDAQIKAMSRLLRLRRRIARMRKQKDDK